MTPLVYRLIIIGFLLIILGSLASAMYYLIRDKGTSDRTIKALTVRITLSVTLFILLLLGFKFGWIAPHR